MVSEEGHSNELLLLPVALVQEVGLGLVILASIILNFSVVFVIFRDKHLRKRTTNIFILNLVFSNALMAMFVMPLSLASLVRLGWKFDGTLCKLNGMSNTMLCLASISTLCCISADRYFAVVKPMRYKQVLTPKRAAYMLILVWFGSLSFSCLPLFAGYQYHPGTNNCSPVWYQNCGLYSFMAIAAFGVPVVILLFTYGMIFSSIRRHAKRVSHWRVSQNSFRKRENISFPTDVTGNDPDSFISQSAVEEEQSNFPKARAMSYATNELMANSTGNLRVKNKKSVNKEVVEDFPRVKIRSRSAGYNRTAESRIPPFSLSQLQATVTTTEGKLERQRPRSCCVRMEYCVDGVIPGTIMPFYPLDQPDQTENSLMAMRSRSLRLSLCDLHTLEDSDAKERVSPQLNYLNSEKSLQNPSDLPRQKIRSHSISFTVSTAQSDVAQSSNIPTTFSVKVLQDEWTSEQPTPVRTSSLFPPSHTTTSKSQHLQLPPISKTLQFDNLNGSEPYQRSKSRSRSYSFGALPETFPNSGTVSLPTPQAFQVSSSPLLRLRAITHLKRRLRVNSIPREYKIAKTGFLLVLVFFLSWGPYMLVHNCKHSPEIPLWVYRLAIWLVYISCILNPIVYALSSRHIRTAFSSHLKCCKGKSSRTSWGLRGPENH